MHKIHPEHDIFKKISTIYRRKMTGIFLTVQLLSWSHLLGSHLIIKNNKKEKKNPGEIIKLLIKSLDALYNYNPLRSQKFSASLFTYKKMPSVWHPFIMNAIEHTVDLTFQWYQ